MWVRLTPRKRAKNRPQRRAEFGYCVSNCMGGSSGGSAKYGWVRRGVRKNLDALAIVGMTDLLCHMD